MNKKVGIFFVMMGAVLIILALLLFGYNKQESYQAGKEADLVLEHMLDVIVQNKEAAENMTTESADLQEEMTIWTQDLYDYIGYISIPDLELELPVMSEWDYKRLKIAPCRHFGSVETRDLVIAAHNYDTHFGRLGQLQIGSALSFTDMNGNTTSYVLQDIQTLDPDEVEIVKESGYDLVLYTCTLDGTERVVAFFTLENE